MDECQPAFPQGLVTCFNFFISVVTLLEVSNPHTCMGYSDRQHHLINGCIITEHQLINMISLQGNVNIILWKLGQFEVIDCT